MDRLLIVTIRGAKRIIVGVIGLTVMLVGVAMLVLPGPGVIVILIGLAALSTEFVWATRWLKCLCEIVEKKNPPAVKEVSALIPVTAANVDEFGKNWAKWLPN